MMRQVMQAAGLAHWPTVSLILFFGLAIGVLLWVYRTGSRETYARLSRLVLDEKEEVR
jgi:cbb3-type cytochrome oxidase subunit 3